MATSLLQGETIQELKNELPKDKGKERIHTYGRIFQVSLEESNLQEQWGYLNDLLQETRRQNDKEEEATARIIRIGWFFNNNLNDSVFLYTHEDMEFYKRHNEWKKYYEEWSILVSTYIYGGSFKTGLQEAQNMFDICR